VVNEEDKALITMVSSTHPLPAGMLTFSSCHLDPLCLAV